MFPFKHELRKFDDRVNAGGAGGADVGNNNQQATNIDAEIVGGLGAEECIPVFIESYLAYICCIFLSLSLSLSLNQSHSSTISHSTEFAHQSAMANAVADHNDSAYPIMKLPC